MIRTAARALVVIAVLTGAPAVAYADEPITPGARLTVPLDATGYAECTANFAFTDGATTYLGTAAHCAGTGTDDLAGSGCVEGSLPLGSPVLVGDARARLAYSSWTTMQRRHEQDPDRCAANDFALVALDPADAARVDPTVPRIGGPTGLDTNGTRSGEAVASYQPNDGATPVKAGRSLGSTPYGHQVQTSPPGIPGDSGAGYLDADGRAIGVLTTEFDGTPHINGVADLAAALDYANRYGGLGTITLVPGQRRSDAASAAVTTS